MIEWFQKIHAHIDGWQEGDKNQKRLRCSAAPDVEASIK